MSLNFDLLYKKTEKIHEYFLQFLEHQDPDLFTQYQKQNTYSSALALSIAILFEEFICELFKIKPPKTSNKIKNLLWVKKFFIKEAIYKYPNPLNVEEKLEKILKHYQDPYEFSLAVLSNKDPLFLDLAMEYASYQTLYGPESILFSRPKVLDYQSLIEKIQKKNNRLIHTESKGRDGFNCTTPEIDLTYALSHAEYCLYCHHRKKDSCSKGFFKSSNSPEINALGNTLTGCPLGQKISEMNLLKAEDHDIAALAVVMIDNPFVVATGHKICNDCMKACIFQKQAPVDVPSIESQIVQSVLKLPYGFEIYSLLTRWNPLNFKDPLPSTPTNKNILIAGLGPSGFTLAHYLLRSGHSVLAIDGQKIQSIFDIYPEISRKQLIEHFPNPTFDERIPNGFGGVCEYGITARWNKNNLGIIQCILERNERFYLKGAIMLGGNMEITNAFDLGFDHVALCLGSGNPKPLNIKGSLAKGVHMASDFLMTLHTKGPDVKMNIEFPIIILGGGLTGVDTATEACQHYIWQIENYPHLNPLWESRLKEIQLERQLAKAEKRLPNFSKLYERWGGCLIVMRSALVNSPSYKTNHLELESCMQEGVQVLDHSTPLEFITNPSGSVAGLIVDIDGVKEFLPCGSAFIAIGTESPLNAEYLNERVSCYGDQSSQYSGSVVKAMASAKNGYKKINNLLENSPTLKCDLEKIIQDLDSTVVSKKMLAPNILEIKVRSPFAVSNFKPGMFFKLESLRKKGAIAVSGCTYDHESIDFIILGKSANLFEDLEIGEKINLMGPTGAPSYIPKNETIALIGHGFGNAALIPIGIKSLENNCEVIYFAGFRKSEDRFKIKEIEMASTKTIWCIESGELPEVTRTNDKALHGTLLDIFQQISLEVDRILIIGDHETMKYAQNMKPKVKAIGVIHSSMQCMMKGICGQCLISHKDPVTNETSISFSCVNQDQNLESFDFDTFEKRRG